MSRIFLVGTLVVLIALWPWTHAVSQSDETVRRTKDRFEREHPGERTMMIAEFYKTLDSADHIIPGAKLATWEERHSSAVFGAQWSWDSAKAAGTVDEFTDRYFATQSKLRLTVIENLLTDTAAFEKFMSERKHSGFYRVGVWKAGYLELWLQEGRQTRTGIKALYVSVRPRLYEDAQRLGH